MNSYYNNRKLNKNIKDEFEINPELFILNEKNVRITKEYIENMLKNFGINHKIKNLEIYQRAMVHVSYLRRDNEYYTNNKSKNNYVGKDVDKIDDALKAIPLQDKSYERLEFHGDSIIHTILAKYLFHRYKNEDEGFMTKLRTKIENSETLANLCKVIGLNKYVLISRHMEKNNARENNRHILEDAFEAFVGALEVELSENEETKETSYNICNKFIIKLIEQEIDFAELLHNENNYKDTLLQYFHQQRWQDPKYDVFDISGPDHKKNFTTYVKCYKNPTDDGEIVGVGFGTSKKKGQQEAAKEALIHYGVMRDDDNSDSDSYESYSSISEDELKDLIIIDNCVAENKNFNFER